GSRKRRIAGLPLAAGTAAPSAIFLVGRVEPGDRAAAGRAQRQADGAAARRQPARLVRSGRAHGPQALAGRTLCARPMVDRCGRQPVTGAKPRASYVKSGLVAIPATVTVAALRHSVG